MTEDEAKTKWCPFVRYTSIRGTGINRWVDLEETQHNPDHARCLGSACMAWRWDDKQPVGLGYKGDGTPGPNQNAFGHCGLAGQP